MTTAKQNASRAAEILRNTKIPQGRNILAKIKNSDEKVEEVNIEHACCMGILCVYFANELKHNIDSAGSIEFEDEFHHSGKKLMKLVGLNDGGLANLKYYDEIIKYIMDNFNVEVEYPHLENLNDRYDLTFDQIADVWEKFPEAYFADTDT